MRLNVLILALQACPSPSLPVPNTERGQAAQVSACRPPIGLIGPGVSGFRPSGDEHIGGSFDSGLSIGQYALTGCLNRITPPIVGRYCGVPVASGTTQTPACAVGYLICGNVMMRPLVVSACSAAKNASASMRSGTAIAPQSVSVKCSRRIGGTVLDSAISSIGSRFLARPVWLGITLVVVPVTGSVMMPSVQPWLLVRHRTRFYQRCPRTHFIKAP